MNESDLPLPERILMALHNLCATYRDSAKNSTELADSLQLNADETGKILNNYESQGYARSFVDKQGSRRYYLTGAGIIRICSFYT